MAKYTLAEARARKKLTVRALSHASGLTESAINNLSSGRANNPTRKTVARLAMALGLDPAQLTFSELEAK